ncbi:retinaldehyde-binding protein 1-like isoform X3 [Rhipicephalus sanguineus]|uniref:retinaldehyde-binding protein 1-like isoform X3 n=1 Tax=Rhipicephalus sanguineus TaxID=34632 RepID=UPI0018943D1B|nr:retinaldehyde-binding protein 1-like isoform X3 [Rhipicephalus sanguineus]
MAVGVESELEATFGSKGVYDMNEELENIARKELGETPEVKEKCLALLRKFLEEEDGFRVPPDDFLLMFLRTKKYRVDEALKTVKNYFRARRDMPELFENLSPSTIEYDKVFRQHKLALFPRVRDADGRAMAMLDFGSWRHDSCSLQQLMRCFIVASECTLLDEETQIRGIVGVEDLKGLGVHHILELTPRFLRRLITLVQVRLVKGGLSELGDIFPLERLPKEYGGTMEDYDWEEHQRWFHEKAEHFENVRLWGYVEK